MAKASAPRGSISTGNPPPADGSVAFVGRAHELRDARALLNDVKAGRGRLLFVTGEPGVGKTRFTQEIASQAAAEGLNVLVGQCRQSGGAAYAAWTEIIRTCVRHGDASKLALDMGGGAALIAQLVPEVRERMPNVPLMPAVNADQAGQARALIFGSIVTFFKKYARRQPLVLVLEDLQWADGPSALLLQALAREIGDAKLLVIGTYRDVEVGTWHRLSTLLEAIAAEPVAQRLALAGLDVAAVSELARRLTNVTPSAVLAATLQRDTAGNPFFVGEVVRLLASHDGLRRAVPAVRIPESVREVVEQRVEGLSPEARRLLLIAAVIGREFSASLLAAAAAVSAVQARESLAEAVGSRVLLQGADNRYSFAHALVRETFYDKMAEDQRAELHGRVGEAIEDAGYDDDVRVDELAHHFVSALPMPGSADKAVRYSVLAAERAKRNLAYEEAVRHYQRALAAVDALPSAPPSQRCELLIGLGDALRRCGQNEPARDAFLEAMAAARNAGDARAAELFAEATLGLGGVGAWLGMTVGVTEPTLVSALEEALSRLGPADSARRARLMARLAMELYWSERHGEREALSRAAAAMARRLGDDRALAGCLNSLRWSTWSPDNPEERLAIGTELLDLSRTIGDRETELQAHNWRMIDLLDLGEVAPFDAEIDVFEKLALEIQQPYYLWWVKLRRFTRAMMLGRYDGAEAFANEALLIGQQMADPMALQSYGILMVAVRREQGRLDEVAPAVLQFADSFPAIPAWRCGLAYVYVQLGEVDAARVELERLAASNFTDLPRNDAWLSSITILGEVALSLGDERRAQRLYSLLLPYGARTMTVSAICYGSVAHFLGRVAAFAERWSDAEVHFEQALRANRALDSPVFVAETECAFAHMLLARGVAVDRARAAALLASAQQVAERLGMVRLLGEIDRTRKL